MRMLTACSQDVDHHSPHHKSLISDGCPKTDYGTGVPCPTRRLHVSHDVTSYGEPTLRTISARPRPRGAARSRVPSDSIIRPKR